MPRETYRYFPISLNSPPADAASFLEPGKSCGHICGCVIVGMYAAVESWAGLGWTLIGALGPREHGEGGLGPRAHGLCASDAKRQAACRHVPLMQGCRGEVRGLITRG